MYDITGKRIKGYLTELQQKYISMYYTYKNKVFVVVQCERVQKLHGSWVEFTAMNIETGKVHEHFIPKYMFTERKYFSTKRGAIRSLRSINEIPRN